MQNGSSQYHIRTTGDLRTFLASMLVSVKGGEMDLDAARTMVKVAAQINESFYSEIKAAQVSIEGGSKAEQLGDLPIGNNAAETAE